jgi:hypothetical protein
MSAPINRGRSIINPRIVPPGVRWQSSFGNSRYSEGSRRAPIRKTR